LAVQLARKFGAQLYVLTVVREVEAILQAKTSPLGYELIVTDLENQLAALIRRVNADDLQPKILVTHGASISPRFSGSPRKPGPISSSWDRIGRP
jgi:hypothetical protein